MTTGKFNNCWMPEGLKRSKARLSSLRNRKSYGWSLLSWGLLFEVQPHDLDVLLRWKYRHGEQYATIRGSISPGRQMCSTREAAPLSSFYLQHIRRGARCKLPGSMSGLSSSLTNQTGSKLRFVPSLMLRKSAHVWRGLRAISGSPPFVSALNERPDAG